MKYTASASIASMSAILEDRGLSRVSSVGNAVAALFSAVATLEVGIEEYRRDTLLLVRTGDAVTPLGYGQMVGERNNEKAVLRSGSQWKR